MTSVFTQIIQKKLPGHFIWRDPVCVVFLSINPITEGHCLIVPIKEVDHWLDLEPKDLEHLMGVSKIIGDAVQACFQPTRVGMMIAGFEVPHTHLHVLGIDTMGDLDFKNAAGSVDPQELAKTAEKIRRALNDREFVSES